MKKRLASFFLALVLLVTLLPQGPFVTSFTEKVFLTKVL